MTKPTPAFGVFDYSFSPRFAGVLGRIVYRLREESERHTALWIGPGLQLRKKCLFFRSNAVFRPHPIDYYIEYGYPPPDIPPDWLAEFEAAARRPLELRMKYAFIKTYKPVMDDEKFRAFNTTKEYREWCEANLPDWLGYGRI